MQLVRVTWLPAIGGRRKPTFEVIIKVGGRKLTKLKPRIINSLPVPRDVKVTLASKSHVQISWPEGAAAGILDSGSQSGAGSSALIWFEQEFDRITG